MDALPHREELATKQDVERLRDWMTTQFAEFKAEMRGWMLAFFVPLWIGVYATLGALVVSILGD